MTGVRCIDNLCRKATALLLAGSLLILSLSGCGKTLPHPYEPAIAETAVSPRYADLFATNLCVPAGDINNIGAELSAESCAGLFHVNNADTLYAKNVYERINPASLTKVMTALVAIENGDLTKTVIASANVMITENGAQKLGIKEGDRMTLDQALHMMLIYSANDVAILVAESVAGSVERFTQMMNERAKTLGATGSHFMNPHGLTAEDHYVTAYDMYLIFYEAMKYREFREIIDTPQYITSFTHADGSEAPVDIRNTNAYLTGAVNVPAGVRVVGGKTGTTAAAGHCLILLLNDANGDEYVSVVMRTPDSDTLYREMNDLLGRLGSTDAG